MNAYHRMEMIAEVYARYGHGLAPFKDGPAACYVSEEDERQKREKYDEWRKSEMLTEVLNYCCELKERLERLEK